MIGRTMRAGAFTVAITLWLALGLVPAGGGTPAAAAVEGECEWEGLDDWCETWTGDGAVGNQMAVSPAGDRIFTWGDDGDDETVDATMAAHDTATGEKRWEIELAGISASSTPVRGFAVSPDGKRVYAVGYDTVVDALHPRLDSDVIVATYDAATGRQLWRSTLGLPAIDENDRYFSRERGFAVAASPDGKRVYVAGDTRLYDRLVVDYGCPVYPRDPCAVTNDDVLIAGFDAATGARQWVSTWGKRYDENHGTLITVSPDSRDVYVGGTYGGLPDFLTLGVRAYRPAAPAQEGTVVWDAVYAGFTAPDVPVSLELAPDGGRVYLTGPSGGETWCPLVCPDFDWATVAYRTSDGAEAWARRYQGPPDDRPDPLNWHFPTGTHIPGQLVVDPDGEKVFVTGTFEAHALDDTGDVVGALVVANVAASYAATLAYDAATGEQVWAAYFPTRLKTAERQILGAGPEYPGKAYPYQIDPQAMAFSLDVSPDGRNLYVVGTTSGSRVPDSPDRGQTTVSYDADTGTLRRIARIPDQSGLKVAVHPGGTPVYTRSLNGSIQAYEAQP